MTNELLNLAPAPHFDIPAFLDGYRAILESRDENPVIPFGLYPIGVDEEGNVWVHIALLLPTTREATTILLKLHPGLVMELAE